MAHRPGLNEKSAGQFGEQPGGGGDVLCHADGAAQWDPAAPGIRARPDQGGGAAAGPRVRSC